MTLTTLNEGGGVSRWIDVLAPARQLAEVLAATDFVPRAMRNNPDAITAAIMYGDELGLGPMQALQGLDVIEGKPRPSAELMRALILRDGHTLTVHEMTGNRCRVSGLRAGRPESERVYIEWTTDMARAAGLLGKSNWRAYPRAMLLARAMSDLARVLFPDVIKGLGYVAETADQGQALDGWAPEGPEGPPDAPEAPRRVIQRQTPAHREIASGLPETVQGRDVDDTPLPDIPEKPADPEPTDTVAPTTLGKLHAQLGRLIGDQPPDVRRTIFADLIGHPLESSTHLTPDEAAQIRVALARAGSGNAELVFDDAAQRWTVQAVVADPQDPEDPWAVPDDPWLAPGRMDPATGELLDP